MGQPSADDLRAAVVGKVVTEVNDRGDGALELLLVGTRPDGPDEMVAVSLRLRSNVSWEVRSA